jgi:hypothetical protein
MRPAALGLVLAPALIVVSCTDLSGLSGDTQAPDAAATDALVAEDAPVTGDASPADAAAPFCESQKGKELCADFDDGTTQPIGGQSLGNGSINVIDGALVVTVPAGQSSGTTIGKDFPLLNVPSVVCELDYKRVVEPTAGTEDVLVVQVDILGPPSVSQIGLAERPNGASLIALSSGDAGTVALPFPRFSKPGKWVHLRLGVSLADDTVQLEADGVSVAKFSAPLPEPLNVKNVIIKFGITSVFPLDAAWTVAFDNIACDL